MNIRSYPSIVGAIAFAVLMTGCGRALPAATGTSFAGFGATVPAAKGGGLNVTPAKLTFTTSKTLTLSISESGYKGTFKIANSGPKIVKIQATAKGPSAKVKARALSAGAAVITVSDSNGNKKKVPVSVTTGVVVIQ